MLGKIAGVRTIGVDRGPGHALQITQAVTQQVTGLVHARSHVCPRLTKPGNLTGIAGELLEPVANRRDVVQDPGHAHPQQLPDRVDDRRSRVERPTQDTHPGRQPVPVFDTGGDALTILDQPQPRERRRRVNWPRNQRIPP